ncbi:MAG: 5'-3' exonuclease H3TH domain-containing protein [Actinoallomurus sp.]
MGGLMLLDTPSLYFRAFFGVPETVTASDGTPVNAVRGLLDMVARLVRDRSPQSLVACMDTDWRPAFRVEALPSYKAHRVGPDGGDQTPDALATQVPLIEEVLDAFGIARIGASGYEADDVIGTLATAQDGEVDVVTGDRDLFQLVRDDKPVRVLYTARGIKALQVVDEAEVTAKYGIPGRSYADFATLRGDPSDGLPGVPGVGDKTAAALITRFGTLEGIEQALDAGEPAGFPAGSRLKLEKARDYLAAARTVVRVETRIALPAFESAVPRTPRDPGRLVALCDRWSLDGPVNRLLGALKGE